MTAVKFLERELAHAKKRVASARATYDRKFSYAGDNGTRWRRYLAAEARLGAVEVLLRKARREAKP